MTPKAPNILFVICDQMRSTALGCAGVEKVLTPHLDAFAQQGTRFTNAVSNTPACTPARATLLTGKWSHNNGDWWRENLAGLRENAGCIGAHLCGAYIVNRCRKRGLIDPFDRPDTEVIATFVETNQDMAAWVEAAV